MLDKVATKRVLLSPAATPLGCPIVDKDVFLSDSEIDPFRNRTTYENPLVDISLNVSSYPTEYSLDEVLQLAIPET
jgi:hypothetical protein